jgi:putative ATPase
MPLFEDYRPADWSDFIGNDKAAAKAKLIADRAWMNHKPFAIWIDGPSGTGKTTLAHLIAHQLQANKAMDVIELDGPDCDGHAVSELRSKLGLKSWGGGFRCVIINEAHSMTAKGVQLWLTMLERLPAKTAIVFTTTEGRGKDDLFGAFDGPLKSRCVGLSLTNQGLAEAFAKRAQEIAEKEGLGGADAKAYLRLVQASKNNMRAVLSAIEGFEMFRDSDAKDAA